MVLAQAVHHKTKSVNQQVYGRSKSKYRLTKGIDGVPQGLPKDCYSSQWWGGLRQYEKNIVSQVEPFGIVELAKKLDKHMSINRPPRPGPTAGPSNQATSTPNTEKPPENVDTRLGGNSASMHVD
jgi:hypothetical protein